MTKRVDIEICAELHERLATFADDHGLTPGAIVDSLFAPPDSLEIADVIAAPAPVVEPVIDLDLLARVEIAEARVKCALDALQGLLLAFARLSRDFSTPQQQRALSEARGALADAGRNVP